LSGFFWICNWLVVFLALYGAFLNSKQNIYGFFVWIITNTYLLTYNLAIGEISQGVLFAAYLLITMNGIVVWGRKQMDSK